MTFPKGILFDFGGTLVIEGPVDVRAGNAWLLSRATSVPAGVTLENVLDRADAITRQVVSRREDTQIEVAWPTAFRLIYDHLGVQFRDAIEDLELGYWQTAVQMRPIPGVRDALARFTALGLMMGVVSNTSFAARVIRWELEQHGLADHLRLIVASSEYAVRKPNPILFNVAAARLGVEPQHIWFVGDRQDTDVAGAELAGMTPVWLRTLADWSALVQRIEQLAG